MRISKTWGFGLLALLAAACHPATTDIQPIVIDLSAARTPAATATPALAATAVPAATAIPAPTATPAPERVAAVPPPAAAPARPSVSGPRAPEEVAQRRIDAYNRRELDALVALYAPDARLYEPPDHLRDSGLEQIRQTFARRFSSSPASRIEVAQRMTQGNFVVDREIEAGGAGSPALVISEIRDGRIVRAWTLR